MCFQDLVRVWSLTELNLSWADPRALIPKCYFESGSESRQAVPITSKPRPITYLILTASSICLSRGFMNLFNTTKSYSWRGSFDILPILCESVWSAIQLLLPSSSSTSSPCPCLPACLAGGLPGGGGSFLIATLNCSLERETIDQMVSPWYVSQTMSSSCLPTLLLLASYTP